MKRRFVFAVIMATLLSIFMTAWVTFINIGLDTNYLPSWLKAFALAWPAAVLISFSIGPKVNQMTDKLMAIGAK